MSNSNNSISPFDPNVSMNIGVDINMNNNKIVNIGDPVYPKDAVNKNYVDAKLIIGNSSSGNTVNWVDISQYCGGSTLYISNNNNTPSPVPPPYVYQNNGSSPISITFFVKAGLNPNLISYNVYMNNTFTFAPSDPQSISVYPASNCVSYGMLVTWTMNIPVGFSAMVKFSNSLNAAYSIL